TPRLANVAACKRYAAFRNLKTGPASNRKNSSHTMPSKISLILPAPPDQDQRTLALDPGRSVIVQAPAGSGKTDLLTRRFLRLLAEVNDPRQIVAITFTKAAASEMRNRILDELERAERRAASGNSVAEDQWSMEVLATRALEHSRKLNW